MKWLKKYWKQIALGLFVVSLIVLARVFNISQYLSLERFQQNMAYLENIVHAHYLLSVIIFILLFIVVVAFGIPVSAILVIVAGYFFGVIPGTIYSVIGAAMGAATGFLLTRYVVGSFIQNR